MVLVKVLLQREVLTLGVETHVMAECSQTWLVAGVSRRAVTGVGVERGVGGPDPEAHVGPPVGGDGDPGSVEVGHGRGEDHRGRVVQPGEAPGELQGRHLPWRGGGVGVGVGRGRELEDCRVRWRVLAGTGGVVVLVLG